MKHFHWLFKTLRKLLKVLICFYEIFLPFLSHFSTGKKRPAHFERAGLKIIHSSMNYFFFLDAFSRAFLFKICFLKRIDSGVTSQYSSSFKNSRDSSSVNCLGFLITEV